MQGRLQSFQSVRGRWVLDGGAGRPIERDLLEHVQATEAPDVRDSRCRSSAANPANAMTQEIKFSQKVTHALLRIDSSRAVTLLLFVSAILVSVSPMSTPSIFAEPHLGNSTENRASSVLVDLYESQAWYANTIAVPSHIQQKT